jgi:hypothetical protein
MPPKKNTTAKKTAVPIPKAGAKSVDPAAAIKAALEAKLAEASTSDGSVQVDAKVPYHEEYEVSKKDGKAYSAYLMCADLKNNNNKFYVC